MSNGRTQQSRDTTTTTTTTTITLMGADPLTPAKGYTPARETSPFRGKGLDQLTLALPYPSSPALCRKDTTYPWSYRLRSP